MVASILPLSVRGATVLRGGKALIEEVDFTLDGRGLTTVIGPNGAGKTTFLRMLHGLDRARKGTVEWACPQSVAQQRQAFVFQTPVMMRRTVLQNIEYPLRIRGAAKAEATRRAQDWVDRIGLSGRGGLQAVSLSGGEKQKLALARALITEPMVLFLDEPCSSLDGAATKDIEAMLQSAVASGTRVVMSSHDLGQAQRLSDEIVFMTKGRIKECQPAKTFFAAPETEEARAFLRGDIVE